MYQNSQINEYDIENVVNPFNNNGFDGLQQTSSNILCNDVNAACNYNDDFSASDDVLYTDTSTTPFAIGRHVDSASQSYPPSSSNEAQYYRSEQVSIQNPSSVMNIPSSLPVNSPHMTFSSPQVQINDSEVFRFEIPGFQIIIIPTSNNLGMQYQPQQDHAFLSSSLYTPSVSLSQLNQEQNSFSSVSGTSSGVNIHNNQSQYQYQQQNSNESFSNFNNILG